MAGIRKAALEELARHIVIPQGAASDMAGELLRRAGTGAAAEWQTEIHAAHQLLEVGGYRSLAAWVLLQLASTKPLWA